MALRLALFSKLDLTLLSVGQSRESLGESRI